MATSRKLPPAENLPRPKSARDIVQAMLEASLDTSDLEIAFGEDIVTFSYQPLSWLAKSRCVSAATEYATEMNPETKAPVVKAVFHLDVYKKRALMEMIKDPPFPLTDKVLDRLPEEIGSQLDSIIPDPFSTGVTSGVMGKDSGS